MFPTPSDKLADQIKTKPPGSVITAADFAGFSLFSAARGLRILSHQGYIRRLGRGLYDLPKQSRFVGAVAPSPDEVALALARKTGSRLQVPGARAANILGLDNQVPAQPVYLTDGPSISMMIGKQHIKLLHADPSQMLGAGTTAGLVLQALRHLGHDHIDPAVRSRLKLILSAEDKAQLHIYCASVPQWIADVLADIAA